MSATLRIEAPTDAQLDLIARLCREQGWQHPAAIYSKSEASEIIGAMFASTYQPDDYGPPSAAPAPDDADFDGHYDDEEVPF